MATNRRRSRTMSLREAASVVFALVALLPILLLVYLLSRHQMLHSTEAQIGLLAAVVVSVLGFVVFRRMVDQIAQLAQGLLAPTQARSETLRRGDQAAAVPGLGEVTEIGQVRDAFYHMLDDLRGSTQRLEDLVFKLGTLNEMVELAARIPRIQDLLGLVLQSTMRAVRATVGSIMILDRDRTVLRLAASRGIPDDVVPAVEVKVGEGVAGKVVEMGEPVLVDDIASDPRFNKANDPQYGNGSFICMPIRVGDRVIGVINMAKRRDGVVSDALRPPPFSSTDLQFLNALMTYIGYAVDNSRLLEEAQSSASQLQNVVDDLKSTQSQLVRGETLRAMGQLSSGMAHHLNNLFAVILGRVELLLGKVEEAGVRRSLEIVQRTAQDGAEVVRRVQRFSRVQPVSDAVAVDLNQVVHEVVELTRPRWHDEAQLRGSRIEMAVEPGIIGAAAGEPAPLREVLMNLLLNAADAITQGGRITIRTWAQDDRVYCSITDTGIGMPEEVRRRALEPFFTTKAPERGSGLGLWTTYSMVTQRGGRMTVDSKPGAGSTIQIFLPWVQPDLRTVPAMKAAPAMVMLVEGNPQVRAAARRILAAHDYVVLTAEGAAEALAITGTHPGTIDLLVADLVTPQMNGHQLAKQILANRPELRAVLFTSANPGPPEPQIAGDLPVRCALLRKPFDPEALLQSVNELAEASRHTTRLPE